MRKVQTGIGENTERRVCRSRVPASSISATSPRRFADRFYVVVKPPHCGPERPVNNERPVSHPSSPSSVIAAASAPRILSADMGRPHEQPFTCVSRAPIRLDEQYARLPGRSVSPYLRQPYSLCHLKQKHLGKAQESSAPGTNAYSGEFGRLI